MTNSFLPLGYVPQTKEQIEETERREKLYDYYGIPYGIFDGTEHEINNEIEKDRTEAQILIMKGEEIPKTLEERLLKYKELEENK